MLFKTLDPLAAFPLLTEPGNQSNPGLGILAEIGEALLTSRVHVQ